jgi:hypothetical protein
MDQSTTQKQNNKPQIGVSSWSLNRVLGRGHYDALAGTVVRPADEGAVDLLDLPARIREFGLGRMELCHFHIPSVDDEYLKKLRGALEASNVELWSLLCDDGDITHPQNGAGWVEWNRKWIDVAAALGSRHARIIAGKQEPTRENLELSRDRLRELASHAQERGVRLFVENWFSLLPSSTEVLWLLGELDGAVGFNIDFGNWPKPRRYEHLPLVAHMAESSHTKCAFPAPREPDVEDFEACLGYLRDAGFSGTHTLIYDSPDSDEWGHLEIERDIVLRYI